MALVALVIAALPALASDEPSVVERLGSAIAAARFEDLSPEVLQRTLLTVQDNLGTLTFTSRMADVDAYLGRAREAGGKPEASIMGRGFKLPAEDAAAANAFLIHAAETDDSDFRASFRASPVIMAPALVMAEREHASGEQFLTALAVGYTLLGRLGAPLGPLQGEGLMSSGVWGPAAGAAIAAKLLRLDAVGTAHAISLAAGSGGGSFQYFYDQTEEKRLVVARAARNGVEAALLAALGEHGPRRIFEGEAGVYRIWKMGRDIPVDYAAITNGFDALEGPLYLYPKFFAASASILPTLEAVAPLYIRERLTGSDIAEVVMRFDPRNTVLSYKISHFETPATVIGAKINFNFVVAAYLIHGSAGARDFVPALLNDQRVLDLARRIRYEALPGHRIEVELRLADGRSLKADVRRSDGKSPEPVAQELRDAKFLDLTQDALTDRERSRLRQQVRALPTVTDMAIWVRDVNEIITAPRYTSRPQAAEAKP